MSVSRVKKNKKRLDLRVLELFPSLSRNQIQSFIIQGKVLVDGTVINKPGTLVSTESKIKLLQSEPEFVSRAGGKLKFALDYFSVDVNGLVVLDAGISTGGFADCLLQRGAKRVYGVDVGYGQVHEKIRNDKRVILLERTNLRYLDKLPELVDLATLDLSFISLLKVMPAVSKLVKPGGMIIALIKPQFEADRKDIKKGGVVRDEKVHEAVINKIKKGMLHFGFKMIGVVKSPIPGATSGNIEFLGFFKREI